MLCDTMNQTWHQGNSRASFMKKHIAVLLCLLFVSNMTQALPDRSLTIAIASNFESTFRELKPLFEKQYHITVNPAFGSTGKLYTQIINGAPFDVFLSGDKEHVTRLEEKKLSRPGTSFIYARGELILYVPGKTFQRLD